MRTTISIGFVCLFLFPAGLFADTLRALIVGDTNDRSIGKSVVTDIRNVETFVRDISTKTGLALDLKVLKGNQIKSKIITAAVKNLKVESNDTVIFYYSGHGFRTQDVQTRWPLLHIPDAGVKGVDFQWVIDTLNEKQPRMLLAITDSCNSFIEAQDGSGISGRAMQPDQEALWKKLFVEFSGRIYASGSIVGQYSFGQDATGGAFTSRFLALVRGEVKKSDTNWDSIMKQATKQIPINSPQQRTQDPQYQIVKGAAVQNPQASVEQEIVTAHPETKQEHSEECQSITEFHSALTTLNGALPEKFNFRTQREDLASYQEMTNALVQAGGDRQMVTLARTMSQSLRSRNWPKFRSAVGAYEGHVGELRQGICSQ